MDFKYPVISLSIQFNLNLELSTFALKIYAFVFDMNWNTHELKCVLSLETPINNIAVDRFCSVEKRIQPQKLQRKHETWC